MKIFFTLLLIFSFCRASAQLSYGKSSYDEVGEAGTMVLPTLKIENTGTSPVEVFVNRFFLNLPANWTQCFCFNNCHPPSLDSLRFTLVPGQTADIGVGFNSDTIPGIGYMRMTVEVVGGTQKDTLNFSGSTYLLAGVKENSLSSSFKTFPNPVSEKLFINSSLKERYSVSVNDLNGKTVKNVFDLTSGQTEISLSGLPNGVYFITLRYQSGATESKRIQKN